METQLVDPLCGSSWDRLVTSHPDACFFHTSAWAKVLSHTYGHEPFYLRLSQGGELLALVPMMEVRSSLTGRRGICLPFTDTCSPLFFSSDPSDAPFEKISELARERKWKYFEVRGERGFESCSPPSLGFYEHTLDLSGGMERLFKGFASSVRTALRKAERSGLTMQVTRSREAMLEFYRLHAATRRRQGLPPQPISFFLNIQKEIIEAGSGFVAIVASGARAIAASVFFHFGKTVVYKFGASDARFQQLRASNLAMWEGIKWLAGNGFALLHFGRTSLYNHGLRRFKLGWGSQEQMIKYFKFDTAANKWVMGRDRAAGFHNAVFGSLPLVLNRWIGAMIYPHLD